MNRNNQEIINLIENVQKFSVLHDRKKILQQKLQGINMVTDGQ